MNRYAYTITLAGPPHEASDEVFGRLFAAGVDGRDDTLIYSRDGKVYVDFELVAGSLTEALASGTGRVEKAGYRPAAIEFTEPLGVEAGEPAPAA